MPGSFPIDPETLPKPIRDELTAPDPVATDTSAAELKDGQNHCPKCGATDIRHKHGSDLLICLFCRNEWQGQRVEEEFGPGTGLDELTGTVVASGAGDIKADAASLMSFKCAGCGAEVTTKTEWTGAGGMGGIFEGIFAPLGLKKIQAEVLANLAKEVE